MIIHVRFKKTEHLQHENALHNVGIITYVTFINF
jgi:hypothetical protein